MRIAILAALLAIGGVARADRDPAFTELERALPSGWSMLATGTELVLRHDGPAYLAGPSAAVVTVELRYHLQPKWSEQQLAEARATNERIAAEVVAQRAKHDDKAVARSEARLVKLPLCTLGTASLFDGPDTYAQLALHLDPQRIVSEGKQVAALVKRHCAP